MFRRTFAIAAGAALVLAGALAVQPAAAIDLGPQGGATAECKAAGFDYGVKLDTGGGPATYVYDDDGPWSPTGLPIALTVTIDGDNSFEWWANPAVAGVLIKAGQGYTILGGGTYGTGTPSSGKGISHITFCYDDGPEGDPEEHLTVTKTVDTSWHRQHHWDLDKSVDMNDVYLYVPGQGAGKPSSATAHWTVTVDYAEPPTDSDFMVWGTITVKNDGDTTVIVDDVMDVITVDMAETAVTVDCGVDLSTTNVTLVPGASLECTYEYEAGSAIDGTNTATAMTTVGDEYESLAMPINWSATPTTEADKTVTVTDVSDLLGEQSKTFTAPTGGSLTYEHTFSWGWYDAYSDPKCGDFAYPNVATLTGDDGYPLAEDTETVNVHVQCEVFQGETAWAANTTAGTLPYNKKGGNWATYVAYTAGTTKTYNVYAGQTMLAGTATIAPAGAGYVTVTVDLAESPVNWDFADSVSNLKIQTYSSAPSGNPSPGLFAYKTTCVMDTCTSGPIPVAKFYGIHLDVGVLVPDPMFP
ncbi:hypothetical protein [Microbacterium sp. CFBP9034]|uniref:hypothetical protein n=1 Tax=Microbacterium sp. CFBP9034 TaxID=3096540 RepID=UPI002A6A88FE|nr:hypothetical protein [Microbacterium sp. CFBP9034]MDY0908286.1 hypothetical protein [Microbacterium sp. CFBP9034]